MPAFRPRSAADTSAVDPDRSSADPADGGATPEGPPLDTALVERARDGDQVAFAALYERHAPMVHAVLLAATTPADADDLMQDVFVAAWKGLHLLRSREHAGAWLATIARNRVRRRFRRRRPEPEPLVAEPVDPAGAPDRSPEILAVLRALPETYAETLAMRLVEGMTGPEIAEATGLTHGSVRVNLSRGMKLYREQLERRGWP